MAVVSSSVVGLATVKREKYSVFNFLNFPSQEDIEPDKHEPEQASEPADKGRSFAVIVLTMIELELQVT